MTSIATQRVRIHRADKLAELPLRPHMHTPEEAENFYRTNRENDELLIGKAEVAAAIAKATAALWGTEHADLRWNAQAVMAA